jgi:hypothetical protein
MALALALVGGVSYRMGSQRVGALAYLAADKTAPLEYYITEKSFSEVENAKSSLEGLCWRFRTAVRAKRVTDRTLRAGTSEGTGALEPHLDRAISELEEGMQEFSGTDQEVEVGADLLLAMKTSRQFERWTELYLRLLYSRPTHPIIAGLTNEAVAIAERCGRQESLRAALEHLRGIPAEFQTNRFAPADLLRAGMARAPTVEPGRPRVF